MSKNVETIAHSTQLSDRVYMQYALELAHRGYGSVSPNPYVGALVVKEGEIIGEGWHARVGEAHAEVNALRSVSGSTAGATLYVTLEPCAHQGRQGACTDAIIEAGIRRVVSAMEDPNPKVSGAGHAKLRAAGIEVITDCCRDEAMALNRHFVVNHQKKRPFVTLKAALSLDGKLATQTGDSQWITGEKARKYAHHLRGLHDAILIGKGTLIADNPMLNVRYDYHPQMPMRVLVIHNFEGIDPTFQLFNTKITDTLILYNRAASLSADLKEALETQGVLLQPIESNDPKTIMDMLYQRSIMSILIEGGAALYSSFIEAGQVDQYSLFYGPRLIGNPQALELWRGSSTTDLSKAPILSIEKRVALGESFYIEAFPKEEQ